jgi:DNA-binding NtrC family response regulator
VLTASNGDEACRLVQPEACGIDLVVSDVVMPQLSGPEFAEYLATIRPDVPVIFMTGYSEYPISTNNGDSRIANHRAIMKPFRPRDLLSIVRGGPGRPVAGRGVSAAALLAISAPEISDCVLICRFVRSKRL